MSSVSHPQPLPWPGVGPEGGGPPSISQTHCPPGSPPSPRGLPGPRRVSDPAPVDFSRACPGAPAHTTSWRAGLAPRLPARLPPSPPHRLSCPQRDLEQLGPLPRLTVLRSRVCVLPALAARRSPGGRAGEGARQGEGPPWSPGGRDRPSPGRAASCCLAGQWVEGDG